MAGSGGQFMTDAEKGRTDTSELEMMGSKRSFEVAGVDRPARPQADSHPRRLSLRHLKDAMLPHPQVADVPQPHKRAVRREATMTPVSDLDAQRNGTWVSSVGHIITAVIGSGVLYLPFFFDVLGWIGGIVMVLLFGAITWYTSRLLADAMVIDGIRHRSYQSAVEAVFGRMGGIILAIVQYPNLVLTAIAYNITGANSMNSFALTYKSLADTSLCTEVDTDPSSSTYGYCTNTKLYIFAIIFGGCQLFLSQLPNLDSAAWASAIGALMSFGYSLISLGMSIYQLAHEGASADTNVTGVDSGSTSQKAFDVFNAFGGIVFAFSFSFILIEISDTLKDAGRGPVWHMKRAVSVSVAIITVFYTLVSVLGYIAYGDRLYGECVYIINCWVDPSAAGLACFLGLSTYSRTLDGSRPAWGWLMLRQMGAAVSCSLLLTLMLQNNMGTTNVARAANIMVMVHMLPAYQVFSQPVFAAVERQIRHRKHSMLGNMTKVTFRLTFRTAYVALVCFIAILLPFFGDFVGLIGALGFWPATVLFPIEMYRRIHRPSKRMTIWLETLNVFCFCITVLAIIGSVQLIIQSASNYQVFS